MCYHLACMWSFVIIALWYVSEDWFCIVRIQVGNSHFVFVVRSAMFDRKSEVPGPDNYYLDLEDELSESKRSYNTYIIVTEG